MLTGSCSCLIVQTFEMNFTGVPSEVGGGCGSVLEPSPGECCDGFSPVVSSSSDPKPRVFPADPG